MYDIDLDRDYRDARPVQTDRDVAHPELRLQTWAEVAWANRQKDRFGSYARQIEADLLKSFG
jgi:hypothetical protein